MKFNLNNKKSKGFTLIEILLVVGFIALASVGVYTIYAKVQTAAQANTESRNLDTIRAGIKGLYGATANFSTINNTVINQAKITPESMRTGVITDIINTFGGAVTVTPVSLNAGTNNGFQITYPKVPDTICTKLVSGGGSQFDQVTVGATVVKAFGTTAILPAAIAGACVTASSVTIKFDSL